MYWENLVFDAAMPHEQGKYWEELLDTETFTDNEGGLETRLQFSGGRYLDLCFPTVSDPEPASQRVFPVLASSGRIASSDAGKKNPPREERNDIAGRQYFVLNGSAERARPLNLFAVELRKPPIQNATRSFGQISPVSAPIPRTRPFWCTLAVPER